MKTILIPVDFSKTCHQAINYALGLFKTEAVNYILLNAFTVNPGPGNESYDTEKKKHENELALEVASFSKKINDKSAVSSILWMGKIEYLPQEIIEENNVDLVVMGTEGIDDVAKYIGKSHAGEFVSHIDANVLVVPCCYDFKSPQNILFTTNYKNIKEESTLSFLKGFIDKFNANVFVLYVNNTGENLTTYQLEVKKQLHDYFINDKVSFHEFKADNIDLEIENFMIQYNIDMVSAIPLHNTFFDRMFHNSIAKKLTEHATKPVLILTNKKQ